MQNHYCLTALTASQVSQITDLIKDCHNFEPVRLGFPEDGDFFLFTVEGSKALSCLIVCKVQEDLWECYAFTRPGFRRKGLFSKLLERLCHLAPAETELVFLLDDKSPDALAAVQAVGMTFWHTEYFMERTVNGTPHTLNSPSLHLRTEEICEEGMKGWVFSAFSSANSVGSCRVLAYGHLRFYLYHVEILEEFRGQGWGTELIWAVMEKLPPNSSLSLQVSAENKAAVKLYKKTGFHLTETLSYYVY